MQQDEWVFLPNFLAGAESLGRRPERAVRSTIPRWWERVQVRWRRSEVRWSSRELESADGRRGAEGRSGGLFAVRLGRVGCA